MTRDTQTPLFVESELLSKKKKASLKKKKTKFSTLNVFAFALFCCSILNLFFALKQNNPNNNNNNNNNEGLGKSSSHRRRSRWQFRREGENFVISSASSLSVSCVKLSGKAYEECVERKEEEKEKQKQIQREKAKRMKEATTRNYYEQRRKQKQEKVKERDEEKERLPAKGGRSGTTKTRALDDAAEDVIDADAMQTIREATILEKPLGRLEEGSGGRFAFPEEESSTSAHTTDVPALQPCAGRSARGVHNGAETTWLEAPERFERQNVQTRKKEFGKLSKKKVVMGTSSIKYHDKASLVLLPSGQVVAFWQSGKTLEGERGQHVRMATSEDEGVTFSNSWPLFSKYNDEDGGEEGGVDDEELTAQWTPVPHVDKDGNLLLFYAESDGGCEYRDRGRIRYVPGGSIKVIKLNLAGDVEVRVDRNSPWTEPAMVYSIYEENFVPKLIANPAVALENAEDENTLILPFWRDNSVLQSKRELFTSSRKAQCRVKQNGEADTPATRTIRPKTTSAGVLVSKDGGASWRARGKVEEVPVEDDDDEEDGGSSENWSVGAKTTTLTAPSVFESSGSGKSDSKLIMYLRSQSGGVYVTESENSSYNRWSEAKKISDLRREPGAKTFAQSWRIEGEGERHRNVHIVAFNDHKKDEIIFDSTSDSSNNKEGGEEEEEEEEEERGDRHPENSHRDVLKEMMGGSETATTTRKRRVKLPDKVRTQLTLAISEDAGADAFDASWTRMKGSVAGVVGSGIAPGLMFHNPWVLRVGCKVLVAYSKMYVAKFGQGKNKEETHYSVRVSHVEFTVNEENVCSSNMRRYVCGNDTGITDEESEDEEVANTRGEEGEEEGSDEREHQRRVSSKSKERDSLKSLQLTRNIERMRREHHH